jgi:hypothetical protein
MKMEWDENEGEKKNFADQNDDNKWRLVERWWWWLLNFSVSIISQEHVLRVKSSSQSK